jgi:hypothetical protein
MTRAEHLAWAKTRALEDVERGDLANAVASMISDLREHPELENHIGIMLGMFELLMPGADAARIRHWIEGFN